MNVVRRIVVGIAGVFVMALVMELAAPKAVHAVANMLVTVTNTPSVNVVNSPSVNVANTPSVTVSGTVPVTGTVAVSSLPAVQLNGAINATVSNSTDGSGNPIPLVTKDADNAARNAYSDHCSGLNTGGATCSLGAVPAGKELVIEGATFFVGAPSGQAVQAIFQLTSGGRAAFYKLALQDVGACPFCGPGQDTFTATLNFPIYADPGTTPSVTVGSQGPTASGVDVEFELSGHLVSLP